MIRVFLFALLASFPSFAQSDTGDLHLRVSDPQGLGVQCIVALASEGNQFSTRRTTNGDGNLTVKGLPFGLYRIEVQLEGFAPYSQVIEVRSAIATELIIKLSLAATNTSVTVRAQETLIDPYRTGSMHRVGEAAVETRVTSLPGRSLQDLVDSQPGWIYEGNAVLHPRGSEYQTQFILDGIPLTDNRSPGFAPALDADDAQSMAVYTAGFPAEYGRKLGGVVEVTSKRDARQGLHGETVLSGGSFDTGGAAAALQYSAGKNSISGGANGDFTARYLNPPVVQNWTNSANSGEFLGRYDHDFNDRDHLGLAIRHEQTWFEIPNEQVQQEAGQRQNGANSETAGMATYEHVFSANVLANVAGMVRDSSAQLHSNQFSTPIIAEQDRGFREGYVKGTLSAHRGRQEWKAGVEADFFNIHEAFSDVITDASRFDPGTPGSFQFFGRGYDREQALFVQDFIRLGKWSLSAGLRWDHYRLLVDKQAVSPRVGVSHYFPAFDLVLHASYDRVFQTPALENLLLASSAEVVSLNPNVLRLPVQPSLGNYYEVGFTKGLAGLLKLDANGFRRLSSNFADDNQLLNTPVSFPISFRKADVYGAEGKIELPQWKGLSGFAGYSYIVGSVDFPVTGGLFLGQSATTAETQIAGRFWDSQDQRNTVRTRFRYQFLPRLWGAAGLEYGSGLPVDFDGSEEMAVEQYGAAIVDRVDFARGRVRPSLSVDASVGADLYKRERLKMRFQADAQNINNRLNLTNFAGLFSGNAVAPPRSFALRLTTSF